MSLISKALLHLCISFKLPQFVMQLEWFQNVNSKQ